MANNDKKKGFELDVRLEKIIAEVFSDYTQYISVGGSIDSNRAFYIRKIDEYIDKIKVRAREELSENGRADSE